MATFDNRMRTSRSRQTGVSGRRILSSAERPQFTLGSSFDDAGIRSQVSQIGANADSLSGLRSQVNESVSNAPDREGRGIRNAASLFSQQRLGDQATGAVTHGSVLDNALRRAKARVGIAGRGDTAIRNQQLKDRLTRVRTDVRSQGRALQMQVTGQNIKAGVNVGVGAAQRSGQAFRADAIGTTLGGISAALKNSSFFNRPKTTITEQPLGGSDG